MATEEPDKKADDKMPPAQALDLVKRRFPAAFASISAVLTELSDRITLEQNQAHAALATLKAAVQEDSGHLWGCPYALQSIEAKKCKNVSCQRVQHILAVPTVPQFLARALALEMLVQHHVRHDPLCDWWKAEGEKRPCSCGLAEMIVYYSEAL